MEDIKIKKMEINESQKKIIEATVSFIVIPYFQQAVLVQAIFKLHILGPFKTATRSVRSLPK